MILQKLKFKALQTTHTHTVQSEIHLGVWGEFLEAIKVTNSVVNSKDSLYYER